MNYLHWKKETRKMYKRIEEKLKIDKLQVVIPKEHHIGVHIVPRLSKIVMPFEHMQSIKKENNHLYSILDITEIFFYHELGHYFQYIRDKEKDLARKKERSDLLISAINRSNTNTIEERQVLLTKYHKLNLEYEKEAWEIGKTYFDGDTELYKLLEQQALETYIKGYHYDFSSLQS